VHVYNINKPVSSVLKTQNTTERLHPEVLGSMFYYDAIKYELHSLYQPK